MVFVGFCLLGAPTMPTKLLVDSLQRLPAVGPQQMTVTIPAGKEDFEVAVEFRADELQRYAFESNQDLVINVEKGKAYAVAADPGRRQRAVRLDAQQQSPAALRRLGHAALRHQPERRPGRAQDQHPDRRRNAGGPSDPDHGRGGGRRLSRLLPDLLAVPRRVGDRGRHGEGSRRPAALHPGDARRGVRALVVHLHPVQHVRRRREDAQGFRPHDDHGAGDPGRPVDGERLGRRRNRRQNRRDAALEADQPAAVRDRQIPRHRLAAVFDVRRAGRDSADHRLVQGRVRRPRNGQPRAELAAMLRRDDRHRARAWCWRSWKPSC